MKPDFVGNLISVNPATKYKIYRAGKFGLSLFKHCIEIVDPNWYDLLNRPCSCDFIKKDSLYIKLIQPSFDYVQIL